MALNAKHILFVNDYMISHNVTESYQKVYGCTEEAARKNGSRLMTNDDIRSEIERRHKEVIKKVEEDTGMSVKWVLEKYKTIIDNNIDSDPMVAKGALDSVGKYYGMAKEKVEVTGEGGSALQIIFSSKMKKSGTG